MNLSCFKDEILKLDIEFLQSILDGAAIVMHHDKALDLGNSNGTFVIFWIENEEFSSTQKLRDYLGIEAEDLLNNYYVHSPISKEYFDEKLSSLMFEYGASSFVSQPGELPNNSIITLNGELLVLTVDDYNFKYGLYLNLEDKLNKKISDFKAKNWLKSGTAYNDYIAVNVFRFSSVE